MPSQDDVGCGFYAGFVFPLLLRQMVAQLKTSGPADILDATHDGEFKKAFSAALGRIFPPPRSQHARKKVTPIELGKAFGGLHENALQVCHRFAEATILPPVRRSCLE